MNQRRNEHESPFRIVGLNYKTDWSLVRKRSDLNDPEIRAQLFAVNGDVFMGEVILAEFVAKNEKALVYSGLHHAFTHYHQPIIHDSQFIRFIESRMGNVVYREIGDRAFTIVLHMLWDYVDR